MKQLSQKLKSLTVFRNLLSDPVVSSFIQLLDANTEVANEAYANFYFALINAAAADNLTDYVARLTLTDENVFTLHAASGKTLSENLKKATERDLGILCQFAHVTPSDLPQAKNGGLLPDMPVWFTGETKEVLGTHWEKHFARLSEFFRQNGCGQFLTNVAFTYDVASNSLKPVAVPSKITLEDLKDYREEKAKIADNIESFLSNLPYSNMLLYGDRGTGKSSTVHAMLNRYRANGLRLIELTKDNIVHLLKLKELLSKLPMKFIIFIDDLTLMDYDDKFSTLKASLEGAAGANSHNTMIIATSNRRHIVKESFSDRGDDVHASDTIDEQLSLSDRFGITVLFMSTSKGEYLSIVSQLAVDNAIKLNEQTLHALAEQWAIKKAGRSPRIARQFVDLIKSRLDRNIPLSPL